ncbi:MAG: SHOCT domain-containing protein [Actinomycetota bacterium]
MLRFGEHMADGFGPTLLFMIVGIILSLLFWVGVLAFGVWAVKKFTDRPPPGGSRAIKILEERFASGEIDTEEYERRRRMLES